MGFSRVNSVPADMQALVLGVGRPYRAVLAEQENLGHVQEKPALRVEDTILKAIEDVSRERGNRGHTVHGTNVWAMMKAKADKEAAAAEALNAKELPSAAPTTEASHDMWYWSSVDELVPSSADLWDWSPTLAEGDADDEDNDGCIYDDGLPAAPVADTDPGRLWDWSWDPPKDVVAKRSLLWDWSALRPPDEDTAKAALLWDWAARRQEAEELEVPPTSKEVLLWDWAWRPADEDEAATAAALAAARSAGGKRARAVEPPAAGYAELAKSVSAHISAGRVQMALAELQGAAAAAAAAAAAVAA